MWDPYCPVCGGPFSHVDILDFSRLEEGEEEYKETNYSDKDLSEAQAEVSR